MLDWRSQPYPFIRTFILIQICTAEPLLQRSVPNRWVAMFGHMSEERAAKVTKIGFAANGRHSNNFLSCRTSSDLQASTSHAHSRCFSLSLSKVHPLAHNKQTFMRGLGNAHRLHLSWHIHAQHNITYLSWTANFHTFRIVKVINQFQPLRASKEWSTCLIRARF